MKALNIEQIQEIIPHRHPFLLVDAIEDFEPGEFAVGYKCVTYREEFFRGHFPKKAVMPGVLILEALAQVGAVAILSVPENQGKILKILLEYAGTEVKKECISKVLWGTTEYIDENALQVNVTRLKKTLKALGLENRWQRISVEERAVIWNISDESGARSKKKKYGL